MIGIFYFEGYKPLELVPLLITLQTGLKNDKWKGVTLCSYSIQSQNTNSCEMITKAVQADTQTYVVARVLGISK